ncbi:indole-3-glycerol phosphate synthase TrpC [Anaerosolibacter sp.]|uniref:indole-3-glycerol phosphate synthase TrpC n=1 Tax=Anaerosolibacter sp. TaxID=1872527 RepID=UPI0039EF87A2
MILDEIVAYKKKRLEQEKLQTSMDILLRSLKDRKAAIDFKGALKKCGGLRIIAEVKKASPSKGIIREDFHPLAIAEQYEINKVQAISVLTEDKFFQGNVQYLQQIRENTLLPLLRKDFMIDPYQIYESKVLGADAILVIAAILTDKELVTFQRIAKEIGLYCLVEVHTQEELERVLGTEAEIIGINNRNLKTFETTLETTEKLMKMIPKGKIIISESGIHERKDMEFLEKLGIDGVLIGEGLMRAASIGEKLKELRGEARC